MQAARRNRGNLPEDLPRIERVIAGEPFRGVNVWPELPGFRETALAYFDAMRTARGTANLIQAQRDFFGLHGFARLDDGTTGQHGPWADN